MRPTFLISVTLTALLFPQCEKAQTYTPDLLKQRWVDSFEEASDGYTVFRPSHYKDFPISRFRQAFELGDDHACPYLVLASNDGHHINYGVWEYDSKTNTLRIKDGKTIVYEFNIIKLENTILK